MTALRPFWMICRMPTHAGSETRPQLRYPSRADARSAARDMAARNGHPFVVLEAVELVTAADPNTPTLL